MRIDLGESVHCSDGLFGELVDVVIDPIEQLVTHLVVAPRDAGEDTRSRLVPIELARKDASLKSTIELARTRSELEKLDPVDDVAYVRGDAPEIGDPDWDVGLIRPLVPPYYSGTGLGLFDWSPETPIAYDRIPKGEVEIRRQSDVLSADHHVVGHVEGFVIDDDHHATHLILERGHFWGRREITIPLGAVKSFDIDLVTLSLTRDEVGRLPAVKVRRRPQASEPS